MEIVATQGEEGYTQYSSDVTLTKQELFNILKQGYPNLEMDLENEEEIKILEYTEGSRVRTVKFGNIEISGVEARTLLGLRSTNFEIVQEGSVIKFNVIGFGHGVGMSQTGADALAKQGKKYQEIINHYYTNIEIEELIKY